MRTQELDYILTTMLQSYPDVSDLNITPGKPLQVEVSGLLTPVDIEPAIDSLTPYQTEQIAMALIGADKRLTETLLREGSCDLPYHLKGLARFRGNIFSQKGIYSIVLRKLAPKIPTIQDLGLPKVFYNIASEKNGLILVTGATGSGKTTSLAALINQINENKSIHIITLEDPIEFVHKQKKATLNQRELGQDFDTFATGLRAAMRQAPKIIFVGEIRDRQTLEIVLAAAQTGHLVMSTLHTIDAGQTINRVISMFSQEEEKQIRIRLSETIRWVVCQRLLPKVGGGRVAALEIMGSNLRVKDCILNGESEGKTFYDIITDGEAFGMQSFDKHILELCKQGQITEETAMAYASKKNIISRGLDRIKSEKGEKTTDIDTLSIDRDYSRRIYR